MTQSKIHHRRSIRLKEYDYSEPGDYYITIVTHGREKLFGMIANDQLMLSPMGSIVEEVWESLPRRYSKVQLGVAAIMPNHFHCIITICDIDESCATNREVVPVGAIHELPLPRTINQVCSDNGDLLTLRPRWSQ